MPKTRTLTQNSALHLYCQHLADELNDAGYSIMKTLRHDLEMDWTMILVKELIWRKIMKSQIGVDSTTKMTTKDIDKIKNTIDRYLATKFDMVVDFPSIESLLNKERIK